MTREDELLKRMEQGDSRAADELIRMFYPDILRYCLWHAPNRSLAEDAVQETFLKAIRYFDRYTHKGKFKPFLYRIAANTCIDMQRKNRHFDLSLEEIEVDPACLEPAFEDIHADMSIRELIRDLPESQQEIVLLRFRQDLTLREIAEATGQPLRTVQTRLRSALKKLRAKLSSPEPETARHKTESNDTKTCPARNVRKEPRHEK